jgi:hypothetical protein
VLVVSNLFNLIFYIYSYYKMNTLLIIVVVVVVGFCYFGGNKCPKVLKDNKEMLLGVLVGLALCSFMGVRLEGLSPMNKPSPNDHCQKASQHLFSSLESLAESADSAKGAEGNKANLMKLKAEVGEHEAVNQILAGVTGGSEESGLQDFMFACDYLESKGMKVGLGDCDNYLSHKNKYERMEC